MSHKYMIRKYIEGQHSYFRINFHFTYVPNRGRVVLLYGSTISTLRIYFEKKLDENHTKILRVVLNKS